MMIVVVMVVVMHLHSHASMHLVMHAFVHPLVHLRLQQAPRSPLWPVLPTRKKFSSLFSPGGVFTSIEQKCDQSVPVNLKKIYEQVIHLHARARRSSSRAVHPQRADPNWFNPEGNSD